MCCYFCFYFFVACDIRDFLLIFIFFFFFKQKTAYEMRISDWSSDVCSSDLFINCKNRGVGGCAASGHFFVLTACARERISGLPGPSGSTPQRRGPAWQLFDAAGGKSPRCGCADWRRRICAAIGGPSFRSEEHTSELQSLMRI